MAYCQLDCCGMVEGGRCWLTIVPTMPGRADSVTDLPLLLARADCYYIADRFVTRDAGAVRDQ